MMFFRQTLCLAVVAPLVISLQGGYSLQKPPTHHDELAQELISTQRVRRRLNRDVITKLRALDAFREGATCSAPARLQRFSAKLPSKSKRVFLIRHAKSMWNEEQDDTTFPDFPNPFAKWRDSPLCGTGITQCTDAYQTIRDNGLFKYLNEQHLDGNLKSFFSPLTRAAETLLLMFGLHNDFTDWQDQHNLPNLVPLPDACERVSTSPNDGQGTNKSELIDRYASFAGRAIDKQIHNINVDANADPHKDGWVGNRPVRAEDKIAMWKAVSFPRWKHKVERVMTIPQGMSDMSEKWWPQKDTFEQHIGRSREKEAAVKLRIESAMTDIMASKESNIVIAGHSHYFRQLIAECLHADDNAPPQVGEKINHYSEEKLKNTEVLMIDFTGEQRDGKYVVKKMETVYDPNCDIKPATVEAALKNDS